MIKFIFVKLPILIIKTAVIITIAAVAFLVFTSFEGDRLFSVLVAHIIFLLIIFSGIGNIFNVSNSSIVSRESENNYIYREEIPLDKKIRSTRTREIIPNPTAKVGNTNFSIHVRDANKGNSIIKSTHHQGYLISGPTLSSDKILYTYSVGRSTKNVMWDWKKNQKKVYSS